MSNRLKPKKVEREDEAPLEASETSLDSIHAEAVLPPQTDEEEDPFAFSDEEQSAVTVAAQTIDPNPERLDLIANNRNPRAIAILKAKAHWEELHGEKELADLDRLIGNSVLKAGIGEAGRENRVAKLLDMLKASYAAEQQQQLSMGEKAFHK